nr:uncharacterized protein K02A2.6-like [Onthophagus taurus]
MKELARGICWWPNIDSNTIEELVKDCTNCSLTRNNSSKVEVHVWESANKPFQRVHIDFAGTFMGKYFFLLVDAFSKYPFVYVMNNIKTESTIKTYRKIFSMLGLPKNGIISKFTAPYHPSTNGQVERFVQTLKKGLKNLNATNESLQMKLNQLLLQYRIMPHQQTKESPLVLMFGRRIRTKLDLILPEEKPKIRRHVDQLRKCGQNVREREELNLEIDYYSIEHEQPDRTVTQAESKPQNDAVESESN